jgi:hypothetical protein
MGAKKTPKKGVVKPRIAMRVEMPKALGIAGIRAV